MRGTKAKSLRAQSGDKKSYQHLKRSSNAQALTTASQQPKRVKLRVNKSAAGHGPTWPHTQDQKNQSRPVIYLRPIRSLTISSYLHTLPAEDGTRNLTSAQMLEIQRAAKLPKHAIEALILSK